ncbi:hypothetical protein HBI46_243610 [Parastagonospora nodorum]|nr:hypothetical protein HBI46_243610 [Parastagonospora nodorum]
MTQKPTSKPNLHASTELPSDFAVRLGVWIDQGLLALNRHMCGLGALVGKVVGDKSYLDNPKGIAARAWVASGHAVAPNGSLMRTHPIGVIGIGLSEQETWDLAAHVGFTTHVDPRCTVSCCVEVALIRGLLRGDIRNEEHVNSCIERTFSYAKGNQDHMNPAGEDGLMEEELDARLDRNEFEEHCYAETLEDLNLDEDRKIGYVYKCLGSAIFLLRSAMRRNTALDGNDPIHVASIFEDLTVDLIMEGGDADTNAAAACALLGAYVGHANLPSHWIRGLAHRQWLTDKTYRLTVASGVLPGTLEPKEDEGAEGPRGLMEPSERRQRDARIHKREAERRAWARVYQTEWKKRKFEQRRPEEQ